MRTRFVVGAFLLCAPLLGQGARLKLELDHLAPKAEEVVNVSLDGQLLEMGRQALATRGKDDPEVKQIVEGLQGIYVRAFEFAHPGAYTEADVESIRKQLSAPGWVRFIDIQDRRQGESVGVYSYMEDGKVAGMAVLAAEPKELTVVNIVGPIDLAKLGRLGGQMGIPNMKSVMKPLGVKPTGKPSPKKD
jgi:hypothetical protein